MPAIPSKFKFVKSVTQPTRWAHGCFCFFVGAKNRNKTRSMGMGIIHPKKKKKRKENHETILYERMHSNPRVFLPSIRAIACLLRVYYAFDHILINSLLYVSSFINNILIIFIFNNYKTLSRSYRKRKKKTLSRSLLWSDETTIGENLFLFIFVSMFVFVLFVYEEHKSILLLSFS